MSTIIVEGNQVICVPSNLSNSTFAPKRRLLNVSLPVSFSQLLLSIVVWLTRRDCSTSYFYSSLPSSVIAAPISRILTRKAQLSVYDVEKCIVKSVKLLVIVIASWASFFPVFKRGGFNWFFTKSKIFDLSFFFTKSKIFDFFIKNLIYLFFSRSNFGPFF